MTVSIGDLRPFLVRVLKPDKKVNGTGFFCHEDGYVLTCWHVVEPWVSSHGRDASIELIYGDQALPASLITPLSDEAGDLAILQINVASAATPKKWPYLHLDAHWRVKIGDWLQSFGYPEGPFASPGISITGNIGGLTPTAVQGVEVFPLAGLNLANVSGGYSGAPLVNQSTQKVIGLVYAKHRDTQAFAVPLQRIFRTFPQLRATHDVFAQIRNRIGKEAERLLADKVHGGPFLNLQIEKRTAESDNKIDSSLRRADQKWETIHLSNILPLRGKHLLISDVGTGKTTWLYWLATQLIRHTGMTPLLVSCSELERLARPDQVAVQELVLQRFRDDFLEIDLKDFFINAVDSQNVVFLFDGLDQIQGDSPSTIASIAFDKVAKGCAAVLSSRPSAVVSLEDEHQVTFLRLRPLSQRDQLRYFAHLYVPAKKLIGLAPDLANVPMLAFMLRELLNLGGGTGVLTRTQLYSQFIDHIFSTHHSNKAHRERRDLSRKIKAGLRELSYKALAARQPKIQTIPETFIPMDAMVSMEELTTFGLVNLALVRGDGVLRFTHQSFQEFLAAQYASESEAALDLVFSQRWHPKWKEVIRFLTGLIGEPLVTRMLSSEDSAIRSDLHLAARCLCESVTVSNAVVAEIRNRLEALDEEGPLGLDVGYSLHAISPLTQSTEQVMAAAANEAESLMKQIKSQGEDVRPEKVVALAALIDRLDVMTLERITEWFAGRSPAVRAIGLTAFGHPLQANPFAEVATDSSNNATTVKRRIAVERIEFLVNSGCALDDATVRLLVRAVRDDNDYVRQPAVRTLAAAAWTVGDAVLAELSDGLQDGNKFVRKTTIELLVQLGDRLSPAILHAICSMLSDDDYVQKEALNAVVKLANRLDESSIALISDFIRSHDSRVRRVALTAAAAIGDRLPPDAVKDLTALLRSKEPNDRRPALQALSSLDKRLDLTVARFVMSALHDPNFMMAEVLEALTNFSSRFTAELICAAAEVLNAESDFFGHQAALALDKLSEQWTPQQIGALRTWLRPQSRAAKLMVAQHMKRLPELLSVDDTWPLVREVLTDREWHIETFKTIGGMADRFGPKYITMLREMLSEEDDHTRWATLKALGEVNVQLDAQTMRAMTGALEDAHEGVRQAAIEGLVGQPRSLPPEIIQAIAARIGDADDDVSRAAQTALAKISHKVDHDSVLFICTGLRQPEERIQHLCLTVLHDFYESGITIPTDKEVDTYMTSAN